MTDTTVASPEPAAPAAPAAPAPTPVPSAAPEPATQPSQPSQSLRGSLESAFDRAGIQNGPTADPVAPAADPTPRHDFRGDDGRFAPRPEEQVAQPAISQTTAEPEPQTVETPPAPTIAAPDRFSDEGKAAWEGTPEAVKTEINRAVEEMTRGLDDYRDYFEAAQHQLGDISNDVFQALTQNDKTVGQVFNQYFALEQELRRDPVAGVVRICAEAGIPAQDIAAAIVGQDANESVQQLERAVLDRDAYIAQLEQQVGSLRSAEEQAALERDNADMLEFFASNPASEDARQLMGRVLKSGIASTLDEAYRFAHNMLGMPVPSQQAAAPQTLTQPSPPDQLAQTEKAQLSVVGSPPATDLNPRGRQAGPPSGSPREAVRRALAMTGMS